MLNGRFGLWGLLIVGVIRFLFLLISSGSMEACQRKDIGREENMNAVLSNADLQENLNLLGSEHGDYQNAVRWFKEQGKQVGPFLMSAFRMTGTTDLQRGRIIKCLGELRDDAAVPLLAMTLQSGALSWESAQALGKIGTEAAGDALIGCLGDKRLALVKECTKALGHVRSDTASAALKGQLQHPDASVRYYAVRSLIQAQVPGLDDTLRKHLSGEQDPAVRRLIEEHLDSSAGVIDFD